MYVVFNDSFEVEAIHDEKRVVKKYVENVYNTSKKQLSIIKIKKKDVKKIKNKDDLYLVRYADTYIQSCYIDYLEICDTKIYEDERYALDILCRIIETRRLNKKDTKVLEKAVLILDRISDIDASYTPDEKQLREMKMEVESMKHLMDYDE